MTIMKMVIKQIALQPFGFNACVNKVLYSSISTPLYRVRPFNRNGKHHTVTCGRSNRRDIGQQALHQTAITSLGSSCSIRLFDVTLYN